MHDREFVRAQPDWLTRVIRESAREILRLSEPLPGRARILLLQSRFPDDAWGPLMMMRILYCDREIWVDRPTINLGKLDLGSYDRVLDFDGAGMRVVSRKGQDAGGTYPNVSQCFVP